MLQEEVFMKIVVVGGTGLIGSKLVRNLKKLGHEVIAASPSTGVNTLTGEGLKEALKGANVVVDVSNSPSFEDNEVLKFFEVSTINLLDEEKQAGVSHHVALSVVGTDLLPDSGYFRAKLAQENLIKASKIPYTIVRATQFFEFLKSIAESGISENRIHLPPAFIQPIASEDVASALLEVALEKPVNGTLEIAGPERFTLSELVEEYLKATNDPRTVVHDANAAYYGAKLSQNTLVPQKKANLGSINFKNWLKAYKMSQKKD